MSAHSITRIAAAAGLAIAAAPAAAQDAGSAGPLRSIIVSGVGEAARKPDMATLSIGVESEGATAAEALRRNSAQMDQTIKALREAGVAEKDLQTAQISVGARYDYSQDGKPPRIIGYQATNTLVAKMRDIGKAGAVIDKAVGVGANRLDSIAFGFADPKPVLNDARRAAVADARDKARLYADAAGVKLGRLMSISDSFSSAPGPFPVMARMEMATDAKAAPIAPGETTLSASVTLVYAIE